MQQKHKQSKRFSWFRLCLLVMVGYFCYMIIIQQTELSRIHREIEAVNSKLSESTEINKSLIAEKEKLSTAEYIEKVAREQLGLVKPGEVPYIPAKE